MSERGKIASIIIIWFSFLFVIAMVFGIGIITGISPVRLFVRLFFRLAFIFGAIAAEIGIMIGAAKLVLKLTAK